MLNKLKGKIVKSIRSRKLNVFGLFFLLAFLFLIITKLSKVYTETLALNIEYVNLPEEHSLISNNDTINVVVKAYGFNLLRYYLFDHSLKIDFKRDVSLQSDSYLWDAKVNKGSLEKEFKNSLEIVSVKPSTLTFPFQSMAVKKVPIKPNINLTFAAGYDVVGTIKYEPDSVRIIGPSQLISNIEFVKTKNIKLNEVNNDIDKEIELDFKAKTKNVHITNTTVNMIAKVGKFTEGTLEIPISVINLPVNTNINFFPKTVTVAYYVNLSDYNSIKALDFKVECDYSEISNTNSPFLFPKLIKMPEVVKNARIKQNKVEYILIQ